MWESIILQGRCGSLLASRGDVGVFKLCLSGSVGIQVSCSAEDHSAVRDGRSPVSKYSRTSLYIAGHLPHLKAIKQPCHHIHHIFQQSHTRLHQIQCFTQPNYNSVQLFIGTRLQCHHYVAMLFEDSYAKLPTRVPVSRSFYTQE